MRDEAGLGGLEVAYEAGAGRGEDRFLRGGRAEEFFGGVVKRELLRARCVEDKVEGTVLGALGDPGVAEEQLLDQVSGLLAAHAVHSGETSASLRRDQRDEEGVGWRRGQVREDLVVRLERYEDGFGGRDTAGAREAVGERDLGGGEFDRRGFVLTDDFVRVLESRGDRVGGQQWSQGKRWKER